RSCKDKRSRGTARSCQRRTRQRRRAIPFSRSALRYVRLSGRHGSVACIGVRSRLHRDAMQRLKPMLEVIKKAAKSFSDDHGTSMGAALAYYTMFSIAPLLFIVILVAGLVFGEEAARGEVFGQLRGLMGESGAAAIENLVQSIREPATGIIGTI